MKYATYVFLFLLVVLIVLAVIFGSRRGLIYKETFETAEEETKVDTEAEAEEEAEEETKEKVEEIEVEEETKPEPVEEPMTKKETELFQAITRNKISNDDLEKLVRDGILTENMIERFLAKMDTEKSKDAPVVEGFSCGRDYATF